MLCEKCGREIGPEELKCPYCGADNPFAVQHQKNMEGFQKDYAATEKEVAGFAGSVEGLGKKAAILVALLVGIIIMLVAGSLNYADHDPREERKRDAIKHAETYAEEADGYLSRGEYIEFVEYLMNHQVLNSPPEEFKRFNSVKYVADGYYECIKLMEEIILRSDDPEYFDGLDTDIMNFCMYVESFYEVLEAQKNSEKDEKYLSYIIDIDQELQAAMRTYFAFDDKELQNFLDLSRARKAVKIQEVVKHE